MNRALFFDRIRQSLYGGKMTQLQVDGVSDILTAWEGAPTRFVAYGLATALAEVGRDMQPVREGFKPSDASARAFVKKHYWTMKSGKPGYGRPAGPFGEVYYGRGYVQLTWLFNYERAKAVLGVDTVRDPDLVLQPDYAARIMRDGMERGWFTGKKLADYLTGDKTDYKGARRIINGQDRAAEIAGYALAFETALRAAGYGKAPERPVVKGEAPPARETPPDIPAPEPVEAAPVKPWWERWPVLRQIGITASVFGISGGTFLEKLDKDTVIVLALVAGAISITAMIIQARK